MCQIVVSAMGGKIRQKEGMKGARVREGTAISKWALREGSPQMIFEPRLKQVWESLREEHPGQGKEPVQRP